MEGDRRSFSFALLAGEVGKRMYLFDAHTLATLEYGRFHFLTACRTGDTMQ